MKTKGKHYSNPQFFIKFAVGTDPLSGPNISEQQTFLCKVQKVPNGKYKSVQM